MFKTPWNDEYCYCGSLLEMPHSCEHNNKSKKVITLPRNVPNGFTVEIPESKNGWVIKFC